MFDINFLLEFFSSLNSVERNKTPKEGSKRKNPLHLIAQGIVTQQMFV